MVVGTTFSRRPPMMAGVAKALAASANTIKPPDSTPGITCGKTMRRNTVGKPAPSDCAACSVAGSSFCREVQTASTMKGTSTCTMAITTPVKVNIILTGSLTSPLASSRLLMTPSFPSSMAQPRVRITTEMSSGPSTMTTDTARQRSDRRVST